MHGEETFQMDDWVLVWPREVYRGVCLCGEFSL